MATFKTSQVERERPDEQFTVECESGEVYAFPHPKDTPGEELLYMDASNLPQVFRTLLGDDYRPFMNEPEIDGWALEAIFNSWAEHYGIDLGNGRASRRSSSGTGRTSKRTSPSGASR